jgi:hypothetical protein
MSRTGTSGDSRWVVRAVALIGVAGLASVGVYLGHRAGGQAEGSPAESARVRATAERVYGSFAGTIEQRNAGGVLKAYAMNGGMDECLEAAGFPEWDWSKSRQYATPSDPLGVGTWLAEPNRPLRSEQLMAQRRALLAEASMNRDHIDPAENKAIGTCLDSPHHASHTVVGEMPKAARILQDQWWAMVEGVAEQVAPISEYDDCMVAAHIPALEKFKMPASEIGVAIARLGPSDSVIPSSPRDPRAKSPAWQAFRASEKQVTDADWQCRKATYDAAMVRLGSQLDHFASAHAAEIKAARAGWRQVQAQAKSLGYVGQSGPLGL